MRDPATTIYQCSCSKFKSIGSSNKSFSIQKFPKYNKEISSIYVINTFGFWKRLVHFQEIYFKSKQLVMDMIAMTDNNLYYNDMYWYYNVIIVDALKYNKTNPENNMNNITIKIMNTVMRKIHSAN
eukprot:105750_1